jgi:phosphatidylglycerophosphatase A
MRKLVLFVATGAGTGYAPIAPGTAGSALAALVWFLAVPGLGVSQLAWVAAVVLGTPVAIWAAGEAERIFARHDDGRITIDEVVGQGVALMFLPLGSVGPTSGLVSARTLAVAAAGFLLFRLFDIWKPFPVRRFEALPGGTGVVTDDLMAGVYANVCGQLLWRMVWPV